jgi:hypothetical protein
LFYNSALYDDWHILVVFSVPFRSRPAALSVDSRVLSDLLPWLARLLKDD